MAAIIRQGCGIYGCNRITVLPLSGFPEGPYEIRMAHEDWVRVLVTTKSGVREFSVSKDGDQWVPHAEFYKKEAI